MKASVDAVRVLHVDDDPEFAELAATFLEREDSRFDVETATRVSEALDRLANGGVDCVVSDYDMPERNGIEFLETVRDEHPDLPFVLYTGKGSEEVASDAISAGVTEYLQKERGTGQYAVLANRIRNSVEKQRAQSELTDREKRLSLFFEQSPFGVIEWDEDFRFVRMNETAEEILGYTPAELVGETWEKIVPASDEASVADVVSDLLEDRGGYHSVNENVRADGERIRCEWHNRVVTDAADDVVAIFSQFRELEERDETRLERQLVALHEASRELMTTDSPEEVARITVEASETILGFANTTVRLVDDEGETLRKIAATAGAETRAGDLADYRTDGETPAARVYRRGTSETVDRLEQTDDRYDRGELRAGMYVPLGDHGVMSIGHTESGGFDDTDRELANTLGRLAAAALGRIESEAELREKNERLENLVNFVSHDLRNPLNVATGRLDLVRADCESAHLNPLENALERMDVLVDDILALAREGTAAIRLEAVDLAAVAERSWESVATGEATLTVDTERTVRADESRLQQLLENLFRNAVEHGGADVDVTVGDVETGFYVEDNGPGIPPEAHEDVFTPGYSSVGTGFGLAIVREVVTSHDWDVTLTDGAEGGARFEITDVETP